MLWFQTVSVALVGALIAFLPGILPLMVIGVRGLALFALAPVVGTALAAGSAILLGWIGVPWTTLPFVGVILVVTLIAWLLRRAVGPMPLQKETAPRRWFLPVAILVGVLLGGWSLIAYIGDPEGISQTNDAVFHFNALRFILETGSASSLQVSAFTGSSGFYPSAWHGLVSMLVVITGVDLAVAVNAITLVIGAVIWPLGIAWLARAATGSVSVAAYAAVLSGSLQVFPLMMFQWGVLYPNALSIALLPAAIAIVVQAPSWRAAARPIRSTMLVGVLIALSFVALLLSQPSSALAWGLVCSVWFTCWVVQQDGIRSITLRIGLAACAWLALGGLWWFFARSTSGSHWPSFRDRFGAVLDVIINSQMVIPAAVGVSVLMLIGLVAAFRRRDHWWIAIAWIAVSVLYIASAAFDSSLVRTWLLGPWYADPHRLAALAPLLVIPLAAMGADALVRLGRAVSRGGHPIPGLGSVVGLAGVAVFTLIVLIIRPTGVPAFAGEEAHPESRYLLTDDSYLSVDERELLESLPLHVGEGERVIANPSTGAGFGYALSGVDVYPRSWAPPTSAAWSIVANGLRDASANPEVCEALETLGSPTYVLDFGPGEATPGRYVLPAMTDFEGQDGFELIAQEDDSTLWRITACVA
ncbi:DUF6541 family protein [Microbacterium murale]|uniref:Uncharacterized protein n=1 Tax=Microbacterium murale TaxID=1081040 RepID=A0ABU0PCH8_9MICO|nr:DUF6541 family protein [Microbacterium murale]MDQ0645025.1 hypothetical protein [Microbacterium murale]